jgi:hypothetical protein
MAEEIKNVPEQSSAPEVTDRGLFDFLGKKKDEETKPEGTTLESDFEHQVKISEPAPEVKHEEEEEKKPSLLEKLHRSDSSSSSSSEEEGSDGEKRKKKKKDKKKTDITTGEGEVKTDEEKKGFMEKLKEKLPGHGKKPEDGSPAVAPPVVVAPVEEAHPAEKKGILEKIKEKLPGYHPKTVDEEKKEKTSG